MSQSNVDYVYSTSIVATFDELRRNNQVLLEANEEKFLEFVKNAEVWRKRWENAELECQRLSIELTKEAQAVANLENKLNQARGMLDKEISIRKRAEIEKESLHNHLILLRKVVLDDKFVAQGTLMKIRDLDSGLPRSSGLVCSPGADWEYSPRRDVTAGSVLNELSFDDTVDLCESRTRAGTRYKDGDWEVGSAWGVSHNKRNRGEATTAVTSPTKDAKKRKSRSVGFREPLVQKAQRQEETQSEEEAPRVPRVPQPKEHNDEFQPLSSKSGCHLETNQKDPPRCTTGSIHHNFVQKTVLKRENCDVCFKRIKFGKIYQKCRGCNTNVHLDCIDNVHPLCEEVYSTPDGLRTPDLVNTPTRIGIKKQIFASPMLR